MFLKDVSWIFPVRYVETDPRENITEFTPAMVAVVFSREVFVGTVRTLAGQRTVRGTALWTKSIETSAARAD